jgi:hypothetical protein
MPTLDVNDAYDPSFMDDVTVVRRITTVNDKGRRVDTSTAFSIRAVVVVASPDDLQRLPDVEYMNKAISVSAPSDQYSDRAVLQGPGETAAADELLWHGSSYLVMSIQDYSGYGRGFVQATAVSMTQPDPSPIHNTIGSA